jgi:hypothetical protein
MKKFRGKANAAVFSGMEGAAVFNIKKRGAENESVLL